MTRDKCQAAPGRGTAHAWSEGGRAGGAATVGALHEHLKDNKSGPKGDDAC